MKKDNTTHSLGYCLRLFEKRMHEMFLFFGVSLIFGRLRLLAIPKKLTCSVFNDQT